MAKSSGPVTGLSLSLQRGETPIHEQLERAIREGIQAGRLVSGSRLPSTRVLSAELGISRGVVTEAYSQLAAEGYLTTRQGAPARVAKSVRPARPRQPAVSLLSSYPYDLRPFLPDLSGFPRDRWMRSLKSAWREAPIDAIAYPDPRGLPALRQSLADYLGRVCGVAADPEQMIVCTGFTQALSLICRWLKERGVDRIGVEDPGWHTHRLIAEQSGLQVVAIPVDAEGLRVDLLEESGASALVVTPAHQFPTGCVLSSARRAELIEWAEAGERLIVEDDFDSEYRHDSSGVGAIQGLAPERVIYVGSASKRLAPGMRLGWALLPAWLAWPLFPIKSIEDGGSEVIGQLALQDFIERGELDRHIRRTRLIYQRRREAVIDALAAALPQARIGPGSGAGMFELVTLPEQTDEHRLIGAAAERGVGVEALSLHCFNGQGPPGIVLGFGNLTEPAIERAIKLLGEALAKAS